MQLEGKKIAILGLGIEGVALFEYLRDKVAEIAIHDKNSAKKILDTAEGELHDMIEKILDNKAVPKVFGSKYLDNLKKYDVVFRSPAIYFVDPALTAAKQSGVVVSSQMKLFFALCPCPIIGVTGTKGKGTTASLISEILKSKFKNQKSKIKINVEPQIYLAGNIGVPAITLIPKLTKYDLVILELSNFQLADIDKSPHIAVVTNLGVDHLDYHKDEVEYRKTKKNIVLLQGENDYAILNHQSTFSTETISRTRAQKKYFGSDNHLLDCSVIDEHGESRVILDPADRRIEICKISDLNLVGRHNLENVAAAALVADILDVPVEVTREAVKRFVGLPHRLELVREINKVRYINDSFATNPDPTMAAIRSFDEDKILILGGSSKGADFTQLGELIAKSNVKTVFLLGVEGPRIGQALKMAGYQGDLINDLKTIDEIVVRASTEAERGDIVIFSPACASFDMFKNYKVRGEAFRSAVLKLVGGAKV